MVVAEVRANWVQRGAGLPGTDLASKWRLLKTTTSHTFLLIIPVATFNIQSIDPLPESYS